MKSNEERPAFPVKRSGIYSGMSKLEYAAIHIAATHKRRDSDGGLWSREEIADQSVKLAREVLEACEQKENEK